MIRYTLKCSEGHAFESWFQSAASFDSLQASGMVQCPACGGSTVEKSLMAPQVRPARKAAAASAPQERPLTDPQSDRERAIAELRAKVEANSDYVGLNFVAEARAMHEGTAPARSIHGEARLDEAKKLIEDGVPVAPLPFLPRAKAN
jgi:hypothetical protein